MELSAEHWKWKNLVRKEDMAKPVSNYRVWKLLASSRQQLESCTHGEFTQLSLLDV